MATLGALRFGKPLVVDNGDLPLDWATMASWFDCVRVGLWDMLWDGSIVKDANFMKLSKPEDGDNFKEVCLRGVHLLLLIGVAKSGLLALPRLRQTS